MDDQKIVYFWNIKMIYLKKKLIQIKKSNGVQNVFTLMMMEY